MAKYLLIESRDPFDSNDVSFTYELAKDLKKAGNDVTLFLVQNGVFPVRPSIHSKRISEIAQNGVEVLAEEFSLKERGISPGRLAEGAQPAPLETVIDQMVEGRKVLWH